MEKFAVDLDKVLDDFEFNEDREEQVASEAYPANNTSSISAKNATESLDPTSCRHVKGAEKTNNGFKNVLSSDQINDSEQSCTQIPLTLTEEDIPGTSNSFPEKTGVTSPNNNDRPNFYTHNSHISNKLTEKPDIGSDGVSLTVYNDISQKTLLKQQNRNSKIETSYDKKLNQASSKPTVSNVFNSLKEYINAPTVSLDHADAMLNQEIRNKQEETDIKPESGVSKQNYMANSTKLSLNNTVEMSNSKKNTKLKNPPNYQNILLPVASEPVSAEQNEIKTLELRNKPLTEQFDNNVTVVVIDPNKTEHVYENIHIDQNVSSNKAQSTTNKILHNYENVNLMQQVKPYDVETKDPIYECIYFGNKGEHESVVTSEITAMSSNEANVKCNNMYKTIDQKNSKHLASTSKLQQTLPGPIATSSLSARKPIGFSNIDDLSEEELKNYLAELEAEERLNETATYENVQAPLYTAATESLPQNTFHNDPHDEDANEAPIFESVVIGELPNISEKQLQEKAKKFRIIDYGKTTNTSEQDNFLDLKEWEQYQNPTADTLRARGREVQEKDNKESAKPGENFDPNLIKIVQISENPGKLEKPPMEVKWKTSESEKEQKIGERIEGSIPETDTSAFDSSNLQESVQTIEDSPSIANEIDDDNNVVVNCTLENQVSLEERTNRNVVDSNSQLDNNEGASDSVSFGTESSIDNSAKYKEHDESERPTRPQTLDISMSEANAQQQEASSVNRTDGERPEADGVDGSDRGPSPDASDCSTMESSTVLGKQPPFWVPDSDAPNCMLCDVKFTVLKRRHHCRACGKVLCNKCCSMRYRLEYQGNIDSRVCHPCYQLLVKAENEHGSDWAPGYNTATSTDVSSLQGRQPNPNNPMEYCSTVPPLQQLVGGLPSPPTVMVPVGVLKREGTVRTRAEGSKSVIFSDEPDSSWDLRPPYRIAANKRLANQGYTRNSNAWMQNSPPLDRATNSHIPQNPNLLPPTVTIHKGCISYHEVTDQAQLYKSLKNECEPPVMFAINRNLYAYVKITNLNCCVNKICWNFTSKGLACVGQDEVILLVEALPEETQLPKDLLMCINQIYLDAIKGNTISELGVLIHQGGNLLGSREHAGFLFIRQTLQCLQKVVVPPAPFLVGLLIHRWEIPWAKVFPLRLLLRLGAEYRYYPCPLVSVRLRDAVYFEIGHTVMKVLADFRNFSYTLPGVRGLRIHLNNRTTDVMFPKNRYDQVIKGLNNSNDHVLAYASNFSIVADSHLVCIQTNTGDESNYQTQAINIHNKPRTVTGASFIVINGALKSSMGLSAKSNIVEDGLVVEIMPEKMEALKAALKNMQDFSIGCGRLGTPEPDEIVNIKWVENDTQFNLGVKSPIDDKIMDGIPSIRVHNGTDYKGASRFIRWTEVFIIRSDDQPNGVHDPIDLNKISESIARATCAALVKLLDLLAAAGFTKIGVRTTIHPDNVGYEAGSEGTRLPPIYMNSLDNELIQVLHKAAQNSQDTHTVLELIFYILDD
ncbi:zinc finger FYVE domain-containing protein 9 isoform X3 [Prorops nasuta]|uniref:zinc finger FYVE domain-containing protein 9 isoform X3 n=1 Tax=Prorops nasuta TaxID=863751 RepID=UPI0034CEC0A1